MKKYLEENYQHRTDLISPDPELKSYETEPDLQGEPPKKYQGIGPKTKEGTYYVFYTSKSHVKVDAQFLSVKEQLFLHNLINISGTKALTENPTQIQKPQSPTQKLKY